MKSILLPALALMLPGLSPAQLLFEPVTIHPEAPAPGETFLIKLEDSWLNGCQGGIEVEASSDVIEIVAESASDSGVGCTQALVPFLDLFASDDLLAEAFASEVLITYTFVSPDGSQTVRAQTTLNFSSEESSPVIVETGSWVSDGLENSGLFVDQQGSIFSANLADYANGTGSWFFGAGIVRGDSVVLELSNYAEIRCVTAPCSRSAPLTTGRMLAVLEDRSSLVVKYDGLLEVPDLARQAFRYRRLDLASPAANTGAPDLVGRWVLGASAGKDMFSEFGEYVITLRNPDPTDSIETTTFAVVNVNRPANSEPDLLIRCQDARPVDGGLECFTQNWQVDQLVCDARFAFSAVGLREVIGSGTCGTQDIDFRMYRVQ